MKVNFDTDEVLKKPTTRKVLIGIGVVVVLLLIFHAGMVTGEHRHSGEHGFGMQRSGGFFIARMPQGYMQQGHGAVGTVTALGPSSVTITGRDGGAQTILLAPDTQIRALNGDASSSALKVGDHVIVLGAPSESGQITAHLIHVMPADMPLPPQ